MDILAQVFKSATLFLAGFTASSIIVIFITRRFGLARGLRARYTLMVIGAALLAISFIAKVFFTLLGWSIFW